LLFTVGISLGSDPNFFKIIRHFNWRFLLVPLSIIAGSLGGGSLYFLLSQEHALNDILAISAGFGYYSLSSILISKISGSVVGIIALITNIIRELITLIFAPIMSKKFGKLSIIASGGATSMDTTLPVVVNYSGKEYTIISIFSGVCLSLLVPVIISLIYQY
jgi:uncharacterized membrane protein YbjE (DUF340 family)